LVGSIRETFQSTIKEWGGRNDSEKKKGLKKAILKAYRKPEESGMVRGAKKKGKKSGTETEIRGEHNTIRKN